MSAYTPQKFAEHMEKLRWNQGQHVVIAAPTGTGKSTLASHLLTKRGHTVAMVSKWSDETFAREYKGWKIYREWPDRVPSYHEKILLWPRQGKTIDETNLIQKRVFTNALDRIHRQRNWCIYIDEGLYMCDPKMVGLGNQIASLFYFGRSAGLSMLLSTQRPAWVPKVVRSSASHVYVAKTNDPDDLKSLGDFAGTDRRKAGAVLEALPEKFDYLYVNPMGKADPRIINVRK